MGIAIFLTNSSFCFNSEKHTQLRNSYVDKVDKVSTIVNDKILFQKSKCLDKTDNKANNKIFNSTKELENKEKDIARDLKKQNSKITASSILIRTVNLKRDSIKIPKKVSNIY